MGYGSGKSILKDVVLGTGGIKTISGIFSSKKSGGGGGSPNAPDYGDAMRQIYQAQLELAPELYKAESEYQPKYADLQAQMEAKTAQSQMDLYKALQPQYSQLENSYTKDLQNYQLQGLQERAPGYIQAFQEAQGTSGINKALQGYAENNLGKQLQAGFQLSPEEQRIINQQSLQPFAQRGTALGSQADLASVLNRYQYTQGRQQQALSQASGIGSYLNQQSQPALASFYQQPMYANAFGGQAIGNAVGSQQAAGPSLFNPESQTGMGSIFGAYNSQMGLYGAQLQAQAGAKAGKSAMYGQIAGGVGMAASAAFCWIARACFGSSTDRWKQFRRAMIKNASDSIISWYCRNGEKIAAVIENSSVAKFLGKLTLLGIELKWKFQK
jgi:hypothetical protein